MSRYIDADKLTVYFEAFAKQAEMEGLYNMAHIHNRCLQIIKDAPTADVVEVVRCKDCKWWYDRYIDSLIGYHYGYCERPLGEYYECDCSFSTTSNDYCSYGERREENEG